MVYHDISNNVELNKIGQIKSTAHLMDRLFSLFIDYLVISPFVLFFLYLSFHSGFSYIKGNPLAEEKDLFYMLIGVAGVVYFSLIQTFFIYRWHATPGQYFLKMKLDFGEAPSLIFIRAFSRQALCSFGFLSFAFSGWLTVNRQAPYCALIFVVLGLSYLSFMTNRKRRTFYDQIADISVVTLKNEKSFFDFEIEYRYWQSLMATLSIFTGVLFVAVLWQNYGKVIQRTASLAKMEESNFFCPEMNELKPTERLGAAIGLNLVNQLSDACLDREADFVLWRQKTEDYSLAYYAKSLTTDDLEKEKKYLNQACYGQNILNQAELTAGCKIAEAFLTGKFEEFYAGLTENNFLTDVLKYEVGMQLGKNTELAGNFAQLQKYNSLKPVKKYRLTEMLASMPAENSRAPASEESDDVRTKLVEMVNEL